MVFTPKSQGLKGTSTRATTLVRSLEHRSSQKHLNRQDILPKEDSAWETQSLTYSI